MRQIISACRLCEELELVKEFMPKGIWRMVRGKDRMAGRGQSQDWGSVEVVETMAKRVQSAEDKLVVVLAILSVAFCLRPWPRIMPGVPTKCKYDPEPFRAKEFWPQRQFIRDHHDGWETEGSDADGVGATVLGERGACGVPEVVQGAKRTRVTVAEGKSGDNEPKRPRTWSKTQAVATETKSQSGEASCEPKRKVRVGQKARASVVSKKDVGSSGNAVREERRSVVDQVRSLAAKAKESARKAGAGI